MKKVLLGLLVVALTVVGCQNYDDQFDSLNDKIASLSSEVSALSAIQTTVTALGTKLDALAGSALTDSDLAEILKEVADVQASVDGLDAVTDEVEDLNDEVDQILEKLGDLLAANAFYEGNLTITNLGQLANAHELIKTGADDPTITVKGHVRVVVGSALKDSIASVNSILAKIRSVQGTVTVTSEVDAPLPALSYVTGDVFLNGKDGKAAIAADKLLTVDGNLHLIGLTGDIALPALGSVGTVAITEVAGKATVTSLNIAGMTAGTVQTEDGKLILPLATSVSLGGTLPAQVVLAKCTAFALTTGGSQGDLELLLGGKDATLTLGVTKLTGVTSITTSGNINLTAVTEVATASFEFTTADSELHLPAVTKINGAASGKVGAFETNDKCVTVDLSALKTLTATMTLPGVTGLTLTALTSQTVPITAAKATVFDAPALDVKEGLIDLKDSADLTVHLGNLTHTVTYTNLIPDAARVKTLKLMAAANGTTLSVASFTILADLTYAGVQAAKPAAGSQSNTLSITASNTKLTALSVSGYLGALTVSGTAMVTLDTTGGYIVDTQVDGNDKLTSFVFAHSHVQKDHASSVAIRDNKLIASVDMSSLPKVQTVTITNNEKLTSITAPSATVLATSNATITVKISGNKLSGTYTAATAPSGTVSYTAASIVSAELSSFKAWIEANRIVDLNGGPSGDGTLDRTLAKLDGTSTAPATGSGVTGNAIVYDIDIDDVDAATGSQALSNKLDNDTAVQKGADGNAATADDDSDNATNGASGISTHNELQLVQ